MPFIRYAWPATLLLAALLAPSNSATVILLIAGIVSVMLTFSREQKLQHLVAELSRLLSISPGHTSVAIERSLHALRTSMLTTLSLGLFIIFLLLINGQLDITVARNYSLLLLIALAPLGLELQLRWLLRAKRYKHSETVRTAIGYASEDARALLIVVALSLLATLLLDIPPALSALQIVFISCIIRPLLSGNALQSLPYKSDQRWRVISQAIIVYGSFIFYFIRHYLDPRFADATSSLVWQASSVAFVTFIACQSLLLLLEARVVPMYRLLALTAVVLAAVYMPALQALFNTAAIAPSDWLWVILAGMTYCALYLLRHRPYSKPSV